MPTPLLPAVTFDWPVERPHLATVTRVVDGDTIHCDIDMDVKVTLKDYPIRLNGCNAAEVSTDGGKAARDNLTAMLPAGTQLVLTMLKDYKYGGEFVANVYLFDGTDLVELLIAQQWAAPWNGSGPQPVPPWPRTVTT